MGNQQSSAADQVWDGLQMSYPSTHSSIHSSGASFMPSGTHKHAHKGVQSSFWELQIQKSKVDKDLSEQVCADSQEPCSLLVTKKITFPRFKVSETEAGTGDDTAVQRQLAKNLQDMVSGEGEAMKQGKLGNWEDGSKGTRQGQYTQADYDQGVYLGRRKTQNGHIPTQISQGRQKPDQGLEHELIANQNSDLASLKQEITDNAFDTQLKEKMEHFGLNAGESQEACLQKFKSNFPLSVDCFL